MRRLAAAAALALFLAPPSAAWEQLRGGSAHDGVAALQGGPWDVAAVGALGTGFPVFLSAGLVESAGALTGVVSADGCALVRVASDGAAATLRPYEPCSVDRLVGATPAQAWACRLSLDQGVLAALDPLTGAAAWEVGLDAINATVDQTLDGTPWTCGAPAIDVAGGTAMVPFSALSPSVGARHRIVLLDPASGAIQNSQGFAAEMFLGLPAASVRGTHFEARAATKVGTGYVVAGLFHCPETGGALAPLPALPVRPTPPGSGMGVCEQGGDGTVFPAVGWTNVFGGPIGTASATPGPSGPVPLSASLHAAGRGNLAAMVLGGDLLVVDPAGAEPYLRQPLRSPEATQGRGTFPAPVWSEGGLVVPLRRSVTMFGSTQFDERWTWVGNETLYVEDLLLTADEAWVLVGSDGIAATASELMLVRLRLADGRETQRLPLGTVDLEVGSARRDAGNRARLAPEGSGRVVVASVDGGVRELRPSRGAPALAVSDAYPAPGAAVTLGLPDAGNLTGVWVAWGDGTLERVPAGVEPTHAYANPGDYEARVTMVRADGTTATARAIVHVGDTPPAGLNFIQTAFAPENANTTWGLIGIFLAVLGGVLTMGRDRLHRARLRRELAKLDALRAQAEQDPQGAIAALQEYRAGIPELATAGHLEHAEVGVLESRATRLLGVLRHRALARFEDRMSPRTLRVLDAAMEDGELSRSEVDLVLGFLEQDTALPPSERGEVAALVRSWERVPKLRPARPTLRERARGRSGPAPRRDPGQDETPGPER